MPCKHSILLRHMANYNIQNAFIKAYNSDGFRGDTPSMHPPTDQNMFGIFVATLLSVDLISYLNISLLFNL